MINFTIEKFMIPILFVVASISIALILNILGGKIIENILERTDNRLYSTLFGGLHTPLSISVGLLGIYIAISNIDANFSIYYIRGVIFTLLVIIWGRTVSKIGTEILEISKKYRKVDEEFIPLVQNIWYISIVSIGFLLILSFWQINITPFLASAGLLGIIVGLAAKDSVSNFFGSMSLYLDDTYRVGDWIEINSGESGRVKDIGIRSTVIETRNQVEITVPNSILNSMSVKNSSSPERKRRIKIPVNVAYNEDIDKVEDILLKAAKDEELILERPEPEVFFDKFGNSSLNFKLLCWIRDARYMPRAKNRLNRTIYKKLNKENIEIPFPQRVVHYSDN